jgi:hypothetical protein
MCQCLVGQNTAACTGVAQGWVPHLSRCYAADALLDASPQDRLPQVVQPHAPVGADQGLPKRCWRKRLRHIILHGIATLQLLLDVLCRRQGPQGRFSTIRPAQVGAKRLLQQHDQAAAGAVNVLGLRKDRGPQIKPSSAWSAGVHAAAQAFVSDLPQLRLCQCHAAPWLR